MRRVVVVGTSAVGKTTFARRLAAILGVPHVELDALHWEPGWQEADPEVFRDRVRAAVEATEAWVVDGGYSRVRPIVWGAADTVVWLDFPLPTILLRLSRRTLARVISREEIWNGNRERWRTAFASRESLYWWVLTTHRGRSRRMTQALASPEYRHIRAVRLRSPRRAERWLQDLVGSARAERDAHASSRPG
ncbi:MAG: adenylate kinase [Chloroflexi bacterium]|nr:adenylate kinase [Chloroflexota bacterium]